MFNQTKQLWWKVSFRNKQKKKTLYWKWSTKVVLPLTDCCLNKWSILLGVDQVVWLSLVIASVYLFQSILKIKIIAYWSTDDIKSDNCDTNELSSFPGWIKNGYDTAEASDSGVCDEVFWMGFFKVIFILRCKKTSGVSNNQIYNVINKKNSFEFSYFV